MIRILLCVALFCLCSIKLGKSSKICASPKAPLTICQIIFKGESISSCGEENSDSVIEELFGNSFPPYDNDAILSTIGANSTSAGILSSLYKYTNDLAIKPNLNADLRAEPIQPLCSDQFSAFPGVDIDISCLLGSFEEPEIPEIKNDPVFDALSIIFDTLDAYFGYTFANHLMNFFIYTFACLVIYFCINVFDTAIVRGIARSYT
ncbi:uncharacterized protein LOC142973967 isoform X2 [Anticarsia gemmatalis]|uniref:uncharacterized protein LOC142973967 isoform X2 n=1 Tax=Anticarsia gemmatalis TaxID=129554 RepID=UPI003F759AC0